MTALSSQTKVARVDEAFGELIKQTTIEGNGKAAQKLLGVFQTLSIDTKIKLFDLLVK